MLWYKFLGALDLGLLTGFVYRLCFVVKLLFLRRSSLDFESIMNAIIIALEPCYALLIPSVSVEPSFVIIIQLFNYNSLFLLLWSIKL